MHLPLFNNLYHIFSFYLIWLLIFHGKSYMIDRLNNEKEWSFL